MKTSIRQTLLGLALLVALAVVALPQRAMSQAASLLFGSYSGAAKAVTATSAGYLNVSFGGGPINTGTSAFSFTRQEATPAAPTVAQVVDMTGVCTAGTHKFAVGVNTGTGHSITSAASANVTCDGTHTKVTVTIPVGSSYATSRDVYASKANTSSPLYLVSTSPVVNDNTTVTYTFNLADASLTATVAPTTNTTADVELSVANNGQWTVHTALCAAGQVLQGGDPTLCTATPTVTTLTATIVNTTGTYQVAGAVALSATAPTIASGGCTSPAVTHANGTAAFLLTIGSACTGVKTVTLTMPAAAHLWACAGHNNTSDAAQQTNYPVARATSTTAVVITSYDRVTGLQEDFTAADTYLLHCTGE